MVQYDKFTALLGFASKRRQIKTLTRFYKKYQTHTA